MLCRRFGSVFLMAALVLSALPASGHGAETVPLVPRSEVADEILYIDVDGVIRVIDVSQGGIAPTTIWFSPVGGWSDAAMGDVNNDGDDEIVAVAGTGTSSRLIVYDPVVTAGPVDPSQQIDGRFWAILYERSLPGTPLLVDTGDFSVANPGADIVLIYRTPPDSNGETTSSEVLILTSPSPTPDGRSWETLIYARTSDLWSDIATGDLDRTPPDELALVQEDSGILAVYQVGGNTLNRIYWNGSLSKPWSDVAIGQVDPDTDENELVLVRQTDIGLPSLVVWRWDPPDGFVDVKLGYYQPAPRVVFLADITGSGDSEIFMMRDTPPNVAVDQLIMRNLGSDSAVSFEVRLDSTNSYRYGAGGDLYGDGKDRIAVLSRSDVRLFTSPATNETTYIEYPLATNGLTIRTGNVDAKKPAEPDRLFALPSRVETSVAAGAVTAPGNIFVYNITNGTPLPVSIGLSPSVAFAVPMADGNVTPVTISVSLDARNLLPDGVYGTNLVVAAQTSGVEGSPLLIPIIVKTTAGVIIRPYSSVTHSVPCVRPAPVQNLELQVLGTAGSTFSAAVSPHGAAATKTTVSAPDGPVFNWPSDVAWLEASSITTTVPSTLSLQLDPNQAPNYAQADVTIAANVLGQLQTRTATVAFVCADHQLYLPIAIR